LIFAVVFSRSSSPRGAPEPTYQQARQTFQHGDAKRALEEAEEGYEEFHTKSDEWKWKFRMLAANALISQGKAKDALALISSEGGPAGNDDLAVQLGRLEVAVYGSLGIVSEARSSLEKTERLCASTHNSACSGLMLMRGWLDMQTGNFAASEIPLRQALASARSDGDRYLEANALLDLAWSAVRQAHFDEGLDWSRDALRIALPQDFAGISLRALGNMGWAYYRLGDLEKAKTMFIEAGDQAGRLSQTTSQSGWLVCAGYVDLDTGDTSAARDSFERALSLARQVISREDVVTALEALAFVSERASTLGDAERFADEALSMAETDNNGRDIAYSRLVRGRIAARQMNLTSAAQDFDFVEHSKDSPIFLKWEAQRLLARLYEGENQPVAAEDEYRTALSTFETARSELQHEDSRLPFLTNATRIYDDYIHFLVDQGEPDEALEVAEYSRGRTLNEGLGVLEKGTTFAPPPLNAQAIARHAGGTILFFWLGEKQSYLWVITPRATRLFSLNASSSEIDAAIRNYRAKLEGPPEILEASSDGSTLYKMLIGPAQDFLVHSLQNQEPLAKNNQIFIIPDGSLNSLNFETLMPAPQHYWIEDVTITSAGSLHLLSAARPAPRQLAGKLLLIGNPVSPTRAAQNNRPDDSYPELPDAAEEIKSVEQHFPPQQQTVFTREQATPAAFGKHPEQFSYIHFVAHGTASRSIPLDSAIILSRDPASKAAAGEDDSFKLYARDIVQHPLHAELVTISACYGAGKRSYSGEGLVGLSWAFLRAGAHNVVGALWDVSSISSAQLMDDFYGELQKGKTPSAALRAAKLKLLHSTNTDFRGPFYWAPFQLYTGAERVVPPRRAENNMR
jgi:CHAT domain-containing protein